MKTWIWLVLTGIVFFAIGASVGTAMAASKAKKVNGTRTGTN